jgi:uncharacterized membrane protein YoaK (UPF0700 family)
VTDHLRQRLVVLLAITSGATDAIGFLALGGAFTSVMTGNMVLLGLSAAEHDGTLASHTAAAIVCFVAGCAIGARIAGTPRADDPIWPRAVTRALAVESVVLLAYAVAWWGSGSHPRGALQLGLLVVNAIGVGIQSSTVQRFGVSGLSTTYLTGTLTTVVIHLVSGRPARHVSRSVQVLGGLIGGAALAGVLVLHAPVAAPVVQLAGLSTVLVFALLVRNRAARQPRILD